MSETLERDEAPQFVWERDNTMDLEDELAVAVYEHVPQVRDGLVEIKAVAVYDGVGKVVLKANDQDATTRACAGPCGRNARAVAEAVGLEGGLNFIESCKNPAGLVARALGPATVSRVEVSRDARATAYVKSPIEAAKAIGRNGRNVRCAGRLTGYRIEVVRE